MWDSHVKGRLRDDRREGEKAGQGRLRFTGPIAARAPLRHASITGGAEALSLDSALILSN